CEALLYSMSVGTAHLFIICTFPELKVRENSHTSFFTKIYEKDGFQLTVLFQLSHLSQMFNSIIILHCPCFAVMCYITQTCVAKLCFSSTNLSTGNLG